MTFTTYQHDVRVHIIKTANEMVSVMMTSDRTPSRLYHPPCHQKSTGHRPRTGVLHIERQEIDVERSVAHRALPHSHAECSDCHVPISEPNHANRSRVKLHGCHHCGHSLHLEFNGSWPCQDASQQCGWTAAASPHEPSPVHPPKHPALSPYRTRGRTSPVPASLCTSQTCNHGVKRRQGSCVQVVSSTQLGWLSNLAVFAGTESGGVKTAVRSLDACRCAVCVGALSKDVEPGSGWCCTPLRSPCLDSVSFHQSWVGACSFFT